MGQNSYADSDVCELATIVAKDSHADSRAHELATIVAKDSPADSRAHELATFAPVEAGLLYGRHHSCHS